VFLYVGGTKTALRTVAKIQRKWISGIKKKRKNTGNQHFQYQKGDFFRKIKPKKGNYSIILGGKKGTFSVFENSKIRTHN